MLYTSSVVWKNSFHTREIAVIGTAAPAKAEVIFFAL